MKYIIHSVVLFLVFSSFGYAKSITYESWIKKETAHLPKYISIGFPDLNVKIDKVDQEELSLINNPVRRNQYINESYAVIAKEFNRCLNTDKANWYHFAAWASMSAGEVINGKKFEDLKTSEQFIFRTFGNWKKIYNEEKQTEIFASTNALIAMEMIPLGNLFIQLFCQDQTSSFDVFKKYFKPNTPTEYFLYKSFKSYHQAISEKSNPHKKDELILLASLYQLNAEQRRIDHLLDKVFWIKTKIKLVRVFFRRVATKKGKLQIGNNEIIDLTKKIDFIKGKSRPKNHANRDLKEFFQEYNVPKLTKKGKFKVGTSNWSNLSSRMRFLSAFFWSYMVSGNILQTPSLSTNYIKNIPSLKSQWSKRIKAPADNNLITLYKKIHLDWRKSVMLVGDIRSMSKRADLFKDLYFQDPNFYFGLSTAHLTLGIDRFASMGESLKENFPKFKNIKILDDLIIWGKELRTINMKMTQLVLFSRYIYNESKQTDLKNIIKATRNDQELFKDLVEIMPLINMWKQLKNERSIKNLMQIAGSFIEWEHHQVIHPRLEKSLLLVSERFEKMLKKIPGAIIEKTILRPFNIKTTISLDCFKKPNHIRTKNFLDTNERVKRAKEFLEELHKIEFDPSMSCFNDPYYDY